MAHAGPLDAAYARVTGERGERVCKDIPEDACRDVPWNFFLQLATSFASKLADTLSDTKLVLTWLLTMIGAPAGAISALVPIREAGSLVPQVAISGYLRRARIRKGFWLLGCLVQGGSVGAVALLARLRPEPSTGWIVVGLIALFAVGRSVCSVSSKDLLGKTVPKTRRGRLGGLASSAAGGITLFVGLAIALRGKESLSLSQLSIFLWVAAGSWLVSALLMGGLRELPSDVDPKSGGFGETLRDFKVLATDRDFRRFCIARALLASTILSFPFYVVLAKEATSGRVASLGIMLVATNSATALSGFAWGRLADHSSRLTLSIAGIAAGAIGCVTFVVAGLGLGPTASLWTYGALFFLVGLAHTGIRLGRKTYVVDLATADTRSLYVAVGNTLIGGVLLVSGSFGALAPWIGERGVILVFALLGIAGGVLAWTLRDVES